MHYTVTLKTSEQDRPRDHEMSAAILLAEHFECNVIFLRPGRQRTPDVEVNGVKWEIKSSVGSGKKTMENNLRAARKQSSYIVIDLRRTRLHYSRALSRINAYLKTENHTIKKVKIITKSKEIIDVYHR